MLDIERVSDCVRTDTVVVEQVLELQRVLVHPGGWGSARARVEWLLVWCMDDCSLVAGEGGDVVIVIV